MEVLQTRRLALQEWTAEDLPAYFDLYSRW